MKNTTLSDDASATFVDAIMGWVFAITPTSLGRSALGACARCRALKAKGTAEQLGKNVRAKAGLNKAILDQGWFVFRQMLDYKLAWNGGWLVAVNPCNTSRTCGGCSHVDARNRTTSQARLRCVACGFEENADLDAARNILRAGHAFPHYPRVVGRVPSTGIKDPLGSQEIPRLV